MSALRFDRIILLGVALVGLLAAATAPAWRGIAHAQSRSMDSPYSQEELATSDQNLRQLREQQPLLFQQILEDINREPNVRDPASVAELATASPALEDLSRSSPEALLGLFLLLKRAGKNDVKVAPR